ncbi:MAG TPA: alpha/beta hydrolase [Xanthomonadaceae bacterium]
MQDSIRLPGDDAIADRTLLDFRGHRLFLRSGGQGGHLLLIHGFPTSGLDWMRLWPALACDHRLHAIDMLGFGRSDKPVDFAYSIAASADQWEALARHVGIDEAIVLAHDYGDTVAQELLARQIEGRLPFRIRAVAFLNGGLFPEAHHALAIQKLLLGPLGPLIARLSSHRRFASSMRRICALPPDEAELREHWNLLMRAGGKRVIPKLLRYIPERKANRERWVGALRSANIPLCLIDGIADPVSGVDIVSCWRKELPGKVVIELDGIGHYPQIEAPERVLAAFRDFAAGPWNA